MENTLKQDSHLQELKDNIENFVATGTKSHKLSFNLGFIDIRELKGDSEYPVDFFLIVDIWKRIMNKRNYSIAFSKLTSKAEVIVNYDNGKVYLKEDKSINSDKIFEELDNVKQFGPEEL